ncbi:SH3 domain-containing protein [Streptomyces sp. 7R007]
MRTTPALRTFTAALLAGGTVVAAAAGTAAAAQTARDGGGGSPVWGTVVSRTALNVRAGPTVDSSVVDRLPPGGQDRVQCMVRGQRVDGNPYWYWLVGSQGWASAVFVDTGGRPVPTCAHPCPRWKDGGWSNADLDDPSWNGSWAVTTTVSVGVSTTWSALAVR